MRRLSGRPPYASQDLHRMDHLLGFLKKVLGPEEGTREYIAGGRRDAAQVLELLRKRLRLSGDSPIRILEFACGFGRVTRHLAPQLREMKGPAVNLVCADIHPEACEFVSAKFGVPTKESSRWPDDLNVGGDYDLVFVLSLFSHLPDATFGRWIGRLYACLRPGGSLMFTTHGEASLERTPPALAGQLNPAGFLFGSDSDQADLDSTSYGTMVVSTRYVLRNIEHHAPSAQLVSFSRAVWWNLQDEWILRRPD
jgi:SAM-dependent methyltransferase